MSPSIRVLVNNLVHLIYWHFIYARKYIIEFFKHKWWAHILLNGGYCYRLRLSPFTATNKLARLPLMAAFSVTATTSPSSCLLQRRRFSTPSFYLHVILSLPLLYGVFFFRYFALSMSTVLRIMLKIAIFLNSGLTTATK